MNRRTFRRRSKFIRILIPFLLSFIGLFLVISVPFCYFSEKVGLGCFVSDENVLAKSLVLPIPLAITPSLPHTVENLKLGDAIHKSLEGASGDYSLAIQSLDGKESFSLQDHKIYDAGSLYKLWVMAAVYKKIERGELKEDEMLSQDIPTLNKKFDIDPESAEQTEGTISLTVNSALTQMITISHNYAALLLTEKIRLSSVANFLKEEGFLDSKVGVNSESPVTSASDMVLFYKKLLANELANKENTDKMLKLLKAQKLNDKLPKFLPKGIEIAHKTGEIDFFSHDAGIVYAKNPYIVAALSKSDYPAGAEERIATISKSIYEYFNTL